jgi:hypothetical protein
LDKTAKELSLNAIPKEKDPLAKKSTLKYLENIISIAVRIGLKN